MHSYYPKPPAGHLPLTPPYSAQYDSHTCLPPRYRNDGYAGNPNYPPRLDSAVDYGCGYPPPPAIQQPHYQQASYQQVLPPISSYYEPIGAPILPPLRMQSGFDMTAGNYYNLGPANNTNPAQQSQQVVAPKEEQVTGGVSAKLDYEMERMTDFVSEAAQGIIQPGTTVHPAFRKWVSQVLAATRLPSATILLSLHYLTVRMRQYPSSIDKTDKQLYRLLAVSMILGSKFLDDNTFINRSWSDVSGIKVTELNALEIEWLALIGFDLHADHQDENGISLWIRAWKDYETRATATAKSARLTPLNTEIARQSSLRSSSASFQPGYMKTSHGLYTPLSSQSFNNSASTTPYISADPWNHSADASSSRSYQSAFHTPYDYAPGQHYDSRRYPVEADATTGAEQYGQYNLPSLASLAPSYYTPWNQNSWEHAHAWGCRCVGCARHSHFHGSAPAFAPQTVMG